jgi:hypothetical protein
MLYALVAPYSAVLVDANNGGQLIGQEGVKIDDDQHASHLGHGNNVERVCLAQAGLVNKEKAAEL